MRNLKKFLALMLAMIMAMSLMLTANATSTAEDFADGSGITPEFAEAVDVLSGMKVFSGDNGNFKPAANITRAEMAAVIYRLVSGDVTDSKAGLYSNYAPFKDVTSDKWYAGYVGYCWNAGLIKGRDADTFDPTGNVTGYEALAMLLRAVGYDKNDEFTGPTWQVNVSSQGKNEGILNDIYTTQYGGSLHLAARRDVIASMTFRTAAYVPTVTYSAAMGYNKYIGVPITGGAGSADVAPRFNPTLGWKAFGLVSDTGIVVGNQDTGETVTRMSFSRSTGDVASAYGADPVYAYGLVNTDYTEFLASGNTGTRANDIATFDAKTGLDLFAHKTEIWYDGRQTGVNPARFGQTWYIDWRDSNNNNNLHTYAYFDRSTLTDVVKVYNSTDDANELKVNVAPVTPGNVNLFSEAQKAGFAVSSATSVFQNEAFERFLPVGTAGHDYKVTEISAANGVTGQNVDNDVEESPEYLYLLISNSANKSLDVVISLNIQTSEITGVDNVNSIKTVTVPITDPNNDPFTGGNPAGQTDGNAAWPFIADNNEIPANSNGWVLEQDQLTPGSTTELGRYEIGVRINGTAPIQTLPTGMFVAQADGGTPTINDGEADGYRNKRTTMGLDTAWFMLNPVTNTKEGTVVSYNPNTGKVNLADGTVLDRSILYNTVVENTLPQIGATDNYMNAEYRFYLTPEGKYLGAERIYGNSFIYGTYMDYDQKVSSSKFEYYLTGVTLSGETTTIPVSRVNGTAILGTDMPGVPYRDTFNNTGLGQAVNGIGTGIYRGFVVGGTSIDSRYGALNNIGITGGGNALADGHTHSPFPSAGIEPNQDANAPEVKFNGNDTIPGDDADIVIDNTAVALGAKYAGTIDIDGTNVATNGADELYFTDSTKFILVSGYGTDSVKAEVYEGISKLRGDSSTVTLRMNWTVAAAFNAAAEQLTLRNISAGTPISEMTYLKQSPFVYAQNRVLSRQADVIILPKAAVSWSSASTTRYVGDSTYTLINADINATQFTMYNNGVAESVWVNGVPTDAATASSTGAIIANGHDVYYNLVDSGATANDGKPIYTVTVTNLGWTENLYTASTMNAQTGSFDCQIAGNSRNAGDIDMMRVDSANISNLNALRGAAATWPGINSLTTLNYAGSLGQYIGGQYAGETPLYVSCNGIDGVTISQIYVCFNQTPTVGRTIQNPATPGT